LGISADNSTEEKSRSSIIDCPEQIEPQKDVIEEIDVSVSLGQTDKSVMLSISDVPDISAENAQKIVEMFAKELSESISGNLAYALVLKLSCFFKKSSRK
jgi:hypothetical protein